MNAYIWNLKGTDEPVQRAAMEMQTQTTDLWTKGGGGEREKWSGEHGCT